MARKNIQNEGGVEPSATALDRANMGDDPMMVAFIVAGALVTLVFLRAGFRSAIPSL